jgi:hypothetical protein
MHMSTSEFDKESNRWGENFSSFSMRDLPDDFSDEDLAFAQELDSLFPLDAEELPPYFVQTLLDAEEPRFQEVEHGFEQKTQVCVFRRLKLRRRLFYPERPSLPSLIRVLPARRSLMACAALMLFIFLTLVFTGPSFASGMQFLLHGASTGVLTVQKYPAGLKPAASNRQLNSLASQPKISLLDAQVRLHSWNMYWPEAMPANYSIDSISLYQEPQASWIDGPSIELDYSLSGATTHGTGELSIREFKLMPDVSVLQVVKDGAAQAINIDSSGRAQAIYVDGQWVLRNRIFPTWSYGQRCELIYQQNGIVFWIVGDQRDGMNEAALLNIAHSLQPFHISHAMHTGLESDANFVTLQTEEEVNGPFEGDVLAIFPNNSVDGPYLSVVDSSQPLPNHSSPNHSSPKAPHTR